MSEDDEDERSDRVAEAMGKSVRETGFLDDEELRELGQKSFESEFDEYRQRPENPAMLNKILDRAWAKELCRLFFYLGFIAGHCVGHAEHGRAVR